MNPPLQPQNTYSASLACVMAAVLWGLFWYPLRLLDGIGWHGLWSALLIYCVAAFAIALPVWRGRACFQENRLAFGSAWPAGRLHQSRLYPGRAGRRGRAGIVVILSVSGLGHPAGAGNIERALARSGALALLIAMTGAVLMLWRADIGPGHGDQQGLSPADIYALAAGLCFALSNIIVRKMGAVPLDLKMGSAFLGVIVLALIAIVWAGIAPPVITVDSALLVLLLGFPFMYVMMWTAQYGVTHLPIQRSSILFLLEIVAGALSAAWLTDETLSPREYLGGILVVSAGLLSVVGRKTL